MAMSLALVAQILQGIIAPVFVVIAVGFIIKRFTSIETSSISNIILYAFSPALIFTSITRSSLGSSEWLQISFVALATTLALAGAAWSTSKALRLDRKLTSAIVLSTSCFNAGNYGLPVNLLAFGEKGLELAIVFFVSTSLLGFTLGVFIASQGTRAFRESIKSVVRLPLIYALIAALVVRVGHFDVPSPILQGVNLMSQAAIPSMLVILGMELAHTAGFQSGSISWKLVSFSSALKLLFPMPFVFLLSGLIGSGGLTQKVMLVQASMPTAVLTVVLAVKFGGDSRFVTSVVVLSTLASVVTLTLLLSVLL